VYRTSTNKVKLTGEKDVVILAARSRDLGLQAVQDLNLSLFEFFELRQSSYVKHSRFQQFLAVMWIRNDFSDPDPTFRILGIRILFRILHEMCESVSA
jgi:hypothetical protein